VAVAPIKLASAYVILPADAGVIDGYLVIQNSGSADRLLAVSSSAGGQILLRGPAGLGPAVHTVGTLRIPSHSVVRLDPASIHLVITQSHPLRDGTEVMLTLVFAQAGAVRIAAQVTNMLSNGGNYIGA